MGQGLVPCDESMMYKVELEPNKIDKVIIDYNITISTNNDPTYKDGSYVELQRFERCCGNTKKWELVEGDWNLRYGNGKFIDKKVSLIYAKALLTVNYP